LLTGLSATALALAATRLPIDVQAKKHKKQKQKHKKKKHIKADAICTGPANDAFAITALNGRLSQTFTALKSGKLVKAQLLLSEPAGSLGSYVLRLAPVDGAGVPTNGVLAEAAVSDANVPTGQSTVSFTFATPASIVAGTTYALVVTRPGSDKLVWLGQTGNNCTGTAYFSDSQIAQFVVLGNLDFNFQTFVSS
jgi:hypothetical protein